MLKLRHIAALAAAVPVALASFAVLAHVPVAVLFIAPVVSSHAQRVIRRERPLAASAPPPRILFQSLLI